MEACRSGCLSQRSNRIVITDSHRPISYDVGFNSQAVKASNRKADWNTEPETVDTDGIVTATKYLPEPQEHLLTILFLASLEPRESLWLFTEAGKVGFFGEENVYFQGELIPWGPQGIRHKGPAIMTWIFLPCGRIRMLENPHPLSPISDKCPKQFQGLRPPSSVKLMVEEKSCLSIFHTWNVWCQSGLNMTFCLLQNQVCFSLCRPTSDSSLVVNINHFHGTVIEPMSAVPEGSISTCKRVR